MVTRVPFYEVGQPGKFSMKSNAGAFNAARSPLIAGPDWSAGPLQACHAICHSALLDRLFPGSPTLGPNFIYEYYNDSIQMDLNEDRKNGGNATG